MISRLRCGLLFTVAACLAATASQAQLRPPPVAGPPLSAAPNPASRDLQGMWQAPPGNHRVAAGYADPTKARPEGGEASGFGFGLGAVTTLPLNEKAAAKAKHERALILKGTPVMNWRVACRPGMPQALLGDDIGGFEIVQTPTRVLFLFDADNTVWEIYLDRQHPKIVKPSYLGHSIGRWEGDKLVVDTVGYNGRGLITLGAGSNRHLHTVTTFWKEDGGQSLKYETYVEDPANLTKPAMLPVEVVKWAPDHRIYEEHCSQSARPENTTDMVFEDFTREDAFPYLFKK